MTDPQDDYLDMVVANMEKEKQLQKAVQNGRMEQVLKNPQQLRNKNSLAQMTGKSDVYKCCIEIYGDVKNYDFLKIDHFENGPVLCQVYNIVRELNIMTGYVKIIGFKKGGILQRIRKPFSTDANIEIAEDEFIEEILSLNTIDESEGAFLGTLEHHKKLKVILDLRKILQKHVSILAKSGAGKSYTVGVLLEEIISKGIPVVILDPHSEYHTLRKENTDERDLARLKEQGLKATDFAKNVNLYSPDTTIDSELNPQNIALDINKLQPVDLVENLPDKITPSQKNTLMAILSNLNNNINFDELIFNISNEESNGKWDLISKVERLKKLNIYSKNPTPLDEIVKHNTASIVSLKGVDPFVRETLVTGLLTQLFEARKRGEVPPFFLVLEECHNFAPQSGTGGSSKSLNIIRTLAGEGRKFGLGLCVISQRPAKVDKNVLSQCGTQIVMKVTNPNDLKSIVASCEGLDNSSADEVSQLNIGTCMLTGIIDTPLKVNVRARKSLHGGEGVSIKFK